MVAVYELHQINMKPVLSKPGRQPGVDMTSNILTEFRPDLERKVFT